MDENALLQGIVYPAQVVARGTAGYLNVAVTIDESYDPEADVEEIGFGPHEVLTVEKIQTDDGPYWVVTVRVFFVTDADPS